MEKLDYFDTDIEVVIMTRREGTWVLAVAKAVLDVILSVAASVILSLLLLSGDVEENPGPLGGSYTYHIIMMIEPVELSHIFNVYSCTDINYDTIDTTELSKY